MPSGTVMAIVVLTLTTTSTVSLVPVVLPPTAALVRYESRSEAVAAPTSVSPRETTDVVANASGAKGGGDEGGSRGGSCVSAEAVGGGETGCGCTGAA